MVLYRDSLIIVNNYSNADLEKVCNKFTRSIKDIAFNLTIESSLKRTGFLGLRNIKPNERYVQPYRKA